MSDSGRKDPFFRDSRERHESRNTGGDAPPPAGSRRGVPIPDDASIPVLTERLTLPPVELDFTLPPTPAPEPAPPAPAPEPPPAPTPAAPPFVPFSTTSPVGRSFPAAPTFAPPIPPPPMPPATVFVPPAVDAPDWTPDPDSDLAPEAPLASSVFIAPIPIPEPAPATPPPPPPVPPPTVAPSITGAHWQRIEIELREAILRDIAERLPADVENIVRRHLGHSLDAAVAAAKDAIVARLAGEARLALAASLREIVDHAVKAELERLRGVRR